MDILWNFYRKSIEVLSKFYRNSIEIRSNFYGSSTEILLKFYRNSIEILSRFYRNSIEFLSNFYRNSMEILKKVVEKWKMMPKELRWQVWWVYEGAWWGLKSKMLVFHRFYHYFLKGQRRLNKCLGGGTFALPQDRGTGTYASHVGTGTHIKHRNGSIPSHRASQKLPTAPFDSRLNFLPVEIGEKAWNAYIRS